MMTPLETDLRLQNQPMSLEKARSSFVLLQAQPATDRLPQHPLTGSLPPLRNGRLGHAAQGSTH